MLFNFGRLNLQLFNSSVVRLTPDLSLARGSSFTELSSLSLSHSSLDDDSLALVYTFLLSPSS